MSDPRMTQLNNFTQTQHGRTIPPLLNPSTSPGTLPESFTVLILGASEGIGEHISYSYGHAGASCIILCARRPEPLSDVALRVRDISPTIRVETHTCDTSCSSSMEALATFIKDDIGRLDCVILNAAYAPPVTLKMHLGDPAGVQQAFDVNAMGTYHAAHFLVPVLLGTEGGAKQFIAVGSMAANIRRGDIANMSYCISKMAQVRMIEYLNEQYGKAEDGGLWAVIVHPGAVETSMAKGNTPESFLPHLVDNIGLCGAASVYLSKNRERLSWLGGRFISATWDIEELESKKDEILEKDLLKFTMALS